MTTPRKSIDATYDHRATGNRFTIEVRLGSRRVSIDRIPDPFVHTTLRIGWRDLLRGLVRREAVVTAIVSADPEIVEDVLELNADYLGRQGSSRRREWDAQLDGALKGLR